MKSLVEKLVRIQSTLKAPKNQRNNFGNYNYRSCEDIIEAVKPLLAKEGLFMMISDKIVFHSELRCYVEATVTVTDGDHSMVATASAREASAKKGMDDSQITGSTSSYARKYALNGMFGIDDTKDADATNDHGKGQQKIKPKVSDSELLSLMSSGDEIAAVQYWRSLGGNEQAQQYEWSTLDKDSQKKLKQMLSNHPVRGK